MNVDCVTCRNISPKHFSQTQGFTHQSLMESVARQFRLIDHNHDGILQVRHCDVHVPSTMTFNLSTARQNGALTDQLCRAVYCIHLPMQIATTIT